MCRAKVGTNVKIAIVVRVTVKFSIVVELVLRSVPVLESISPTPPWHPGDVSSLEVEVQIHTDLIQFHPVLKQNMSQSPKLC